MNPGVLLGVGLLGLGVYSLKRPVPFWLEDSQTRLQKLRGNSHANVNMSHVLSHWQPVFSPQRYRVGSTFSKRVRATTNTIHSTSGSTRVAGINEVGQNNYVRPGAWNSLRPVSARLYSKYG